MSYSVFAQYYDELTDNVRYAERADYFDRLLQQFQAPGPILLDLACGTGSLSFELARKGYDVIGVDGSPDMLSVALQKQGEQPEGTPQVLFLCQPMEELDLYGTIDAAVCALDSLNHVVDPELLQRIFDQVSLFLNPGGLFLFDLNSEYKHREVLGNNVFLYDREDVYCVWQNGYDPDTGIVEINLDFFEYDEEADCYYRSEESFCERAYPLEQIQKLLEKSGMELLGCYGDDSMEPVQETTQRIICAARKV